MLSKVYPTIKQSPGSPRPATDPTAPPHWPIRTVAPLATRRRKGRSRSPARPAPGAQAQPSASAARPPVPQRSSPVSPPCRRRPSNPPAAGPGHSRPGSQTLLDNQVNQPIHGRCLRRRRLAPRFTASTAPPPVLTARVFLSLRAYGSVPMNTALRQFPSAGRAAGSDPPSGSLPLPLLE